MEFALSTRMFSALPADEVMSLAKDAGYSAIALDGERLPAGASVERALEIHALAQEHGLEIAAYDPLVGRFAEAGVPSVAFEEAQAAARLSEALGCRRLIVHPSDRPRDPAALMEYLQAEADRIQKLVDEFQGGPIEICIAMRPGSLAHDHFAIVGLLQWVDRFEARVVFDAVELHRAREGASEDALRSVEDRVAVFLLRNFRFDEQGGPIDTPLLGGIVDYRPHLRRLHDTEYGGPLVLCSHFPAEPHVLAPEAARIEISSAKGLLGNS